MPPKHKRPASKHAEDKFVVADDGDGAEPASKRTRKDKPKEIGKKCEDDEGNAYWELGGRLRRVTASKFKGRMLISIREHYEKDGKVLPGKKGISLNTEQFEALVSVLPQIEAALAAEGVHIGRPEYNAVSPVPGGPVQDAARGEAAARGQEEEEGVVSKGQVTRESGDEE